MFRKLHFFLFILLLSGILCFPNTFADEEGDPIDAEDNLEFQMGTEQIIDGPDFEKMRHLPEYSDDYRLGIAVGKITIKDGGVCTGFLIGPDLFMTNHHCIHADKGEGPLYPVEGSEIYMDYYQERSVDPTLGGVTALVKYVVEMDKDKDYALLRLDRKLYTYGWLRLGPTTLDPISLKESVKIIQHPAGGEPQREKEIVRNNSQIVSIEQKIPRKHWKHYPQLKYSIGYLADTEGGSSGSPVFLHERDRRLVTAINHSSWYHRETKEPYFNAGTQMRYILPEMHWHQPIEFPDPTVESVHANGAIGLRGPPRHIRPGETFTLYAIVKNIGDVPSPRTLLRFDRRSYSGDAATLNTFTDEDGEPIDAEDNGEFKIDPLPIYTAPVRSLRAGEKTEVNVTLSASTQGTRDIVVATKLVYIPNDRDPRNNEIGVATRIIVSRPDLVVDHAPYIIGIGTGVAAGESFTLAAFIENRSPAASTATTLRFYQHTNSGKTQVGAVYVEPLNPYKEVEPTVSIIAPALVGSYRYSACVDPSEAETARSNNCSPSVAVTVRTPPAYVYWIEADRRKIQRANLDDGSYIRDIVLTAKIPTGIAVDQTGGKMYWTDAGTDKIQRANRDGSNIEALVTIGLRDPTSIAVDLIDGKMYWTDAGTDKIQRANLNGSNIEDIVTTGLQTPTGIAIDLIDGKVYWTDAGTRKIQRANLDGSTIEDIITTGLQTPMGIAVDMENGKVYWTDNGTDKIQRANLDGSTIEDIITTGLQTPTGIAVDPLDIENAADGKVYWTDAGTRKIRRVNFDGSNIEDLIITGLNRPTGITLGIPQTVPTRPPRPGPGGDTADVNGDGQVTVIDLAIIATLYGTQVPAGGSLRADVNADGIVNILDLTTVAAAIDAASENAEQAEDLQGVLEAIAAAVNIIEAVAAAPGRRTTSQQVLFSASTYENVATAFTDAKHLAPDDVRLQKWMPLLENLLLMLTEMRHIPDTTALLPNYPNPFNPETWIPYHLAQDADVTVTIHDVRGSIVRELTLGHQPAGVYESRGRAAYWDGRNRHGEPVASGLYFYTLTAGEFNATRKLLIAK